METKGTTGEETISYWFDLPIDVAEFEEKLGIGAETERRFLAKHFPESRQRFLWPVWDRICWE